MGDHDWAEMHDGGDAETVESIFPEAVQAYITGFLNGSLVQRGEPGNVTGFLIIAVNEDPDDGRVGLLRIGSSSTEESTEAMLALVAVYERWDAARKAWLS